MLYTFHFLKNRLSSTLASVWMGADHLSQVRLIVDLSNSRVGEVDEVVSAGLLQEGDVLQVHLHVLKHFGQILVVLWWDEHKQTHKVTTSSFIFVPMRQIILSDSYTYLSVFLPHHSSVEEGVDVEHGLQLQSVIQTIVLMALPTRHDDNTAWYITEDLKYTNQFESICSF